MKKILLTTLAILSISSQSFAGEGLSAWEKFSDGTLADEDLIAGTDVSDTTQSNEGSSKAFTFLQLRTALAAYFAGVLTSDQNYVSDAQLVVIGNTSGTNTGDNATNTQYSGLVTSKQDADTDLTDLADGSLTGSKVGTGINGDNITSGTVADARIASTIARDSEIPTSAGSLTIVATGFDGNLATTDDTVQELAQKVDDLVIPTDTDDQTASEVPVTATGFDGNLATTDNTVQKVAQKVDDLVLGSGGATAINDLTDVDTTGKATGKVLKFDSSGNMVVGDDEIGASGTGDITGVTAGTGLTGGGDTGAITVGLSQATQDAIAANTAKISDVPVVSTVRTAAAGGSTTAPPSEAVVGNALATKGPGTITGVSAGTGLQGGGSSGDISFSLSEAFLAEYSGLASEASVLTKTNTSVYTPTADYHPATKKYVDDNSGSTEVVDEAFSAANFDADTTHAVSQDDFYDRMHLFDADDDGSFTDESWFPSTTGAPTSASYLTATAEAGLSAESNLGALTTGLLKITVAAGAATPSTAVAGTDYQAPLTNPVVQANLGTGMYTFLGTPSGANLAATLTSALPASKGGTGLTSLSANVVSYLGAADYSAMRTLLGLVIGTNVQAYDADLTSWAGVTPGTGVGTFLATPSTTNFFSMLTGEGAFAATLLGYADAAAVLAGIGAQAADADLTDLADGSLTGSKVGTGINGDNVTSGTIADARIASTIARDSELPNLAAPGTIGGTTPGVVNATTIAAGAGGFAVDADGDTTVKSINQAKASGVAGDIGLYEANSTDTHAAGFRGPASLTGDTAFRLQFPNAGATEAAFMVIGASTSGAGTAADPYIHPMPFVTLDPLFQVTGSAISFKSTAVPNMAGISFGADPADSGAVRLSNNTAIYWEAATPGTDIPIAVDGSNIIQMGQNAAGINFNSAPITGFSLAATAVTFSDPDSLFTATNVNTALAEFNDSINAGAPNGTGAKVHWSQLLGVPAGFADGSDDGAGGTPTAITVADTTDTSSYVALFESATGDLGPKTDAGLTYNAGTGMLTATGFTGPLTGTASGNSTASSTDTMTNKTLNVASTGNDVTVPLNGLLDIAITDPADADDLIFKKTQSALTLTDIHCLAEGGGTITVTYQECSTAGASCGNIEGAITADSDGAEDDGTLTDGAIAAGAWIKVLFSAPTGTVNNVACTVYGTQTW